MLKQCLPHEQYRLTASSQQQRYYVYLGKTHCCAETPKLALAELIQRVETLHNQLISSSQNWLRSRAKLLKISVRVLHLAGTKGISGTIPCQANLHTGLVWSFFVDTYFSFDATAPTLLLTMYIYICKYFIMQKVSVPG